MTLDGWATFINRLSLSANCRGKGYMIYWFIANHKRANETNQQSTKLSVTLLQLFAISNLSSFANSNFVYFRLFSSRELISKGKKPRNVRFRNIVYTWSEIWLDPWKTSYLAKNLPESTGIINYSVECLNYLSLKQPKSKIKILMESLKTFFVSCLISTAKLTLHYFFRCPAIQKWTYLNLNMLQST